ncbi:MAG: SGNH/GDSL hydrolase family protein [Lachnospiraceae bacterium]|nr:SGNH/GDSL hydrolase family protein [Lachnospiraceae bacterium]
MVKNRINRWLLGGVILYSLLVTVGCGTQSDIKQGQTENNQTEMQVPEEEQQALEKQTEDEVDVQVTSENKLEGLQLAILGDSLSAFEGYIPEGYNVFFPYSGDVTEVDQMWWKQLLDETGMELCANASSSGSTCSGDSLSMDNVMYGCSEYRIADLVGRDGTYPDVIIVYMGTNDLLKSIPIGENDGTVYVEEGNIEDFSDAYCLMLEKLETQYPCARIFCCTLTEIGEWGEEQPFVTFENGIGLTAKDYSETIRKIATAKGYTVMDLEYCGITIDNMQQFISDGVHFNPEGMKMIEGVIYRTLEENY